MPRVQIYQGGNIQRQGTTDARFRPADFGASPLAEGLKGIGEAGSKAVEALDQIEDVKATVEANRLAIEHSEHVREISRRVSETLGEGAEGAANAGVADLEKATKDILGRASPRARLLLENKLKVNSGVAADQFLDHGFKQKAEALESSSVARIDRTVEDASDIDDEQAAIAHLADIPALNQKRAQFFGKDQAWLDNENAKAKSGFFKSRALKLAAGKTGSASAAIEYATAHRAEMLDNDYNAVLASYSDNALDEQVAAEVDGSPLPSATTTITSSDETTPEGKPVAVRKLDGGAYFRSMILPNEGSKRVMDNNGHWAKFGVNEGANPDVDTRTLTQSGAEQIFLKRYWNPSGAANLPPALAAMHVDTYYLNPTKAKQILKASGGDPDRYMELRRNFLASLHRSDPAKYPNYEGRNKRVEAFANRQGGKLVATAPIDIAPHTDLRPTIDAVMARSDIGLAYKTKLVAALKSRQAEARAEQANQEDLAHRTVQDQITALGDDFTDPVKQIPPEQWAALSPDSRAAFTNQAKNNKETKPLPLDVQEQISFLEHYYPEAFADPKVQRDLAKKGVSTKQLGALVQVAGAARADKIKGGPKQIQMDELRTLSQQFLEAKGVRYWTTEAKKENKAEWAREEKVDAQRRMKFMNTVASYARTWALAHPGQEPDYQTKQQFIARAAVLTPSGTPVGAAGDNELVAQIGPRNVEYISRKLRKIGRAVNNTNIADYYRDWNMGGGPNRKRL